MTKRVAVPTKLDWGDLSVDPEIRYAWKLFGGKAVAEAAPLFIDNPIERASELRFCTTRVFSYYIHCFVDFLLSSEAAGESDVASCFLRLVRDRTASDPAFRGELGSLLPAVEAIASRQEFYEADYNIYVSFPALAAEIHAKVSC